jgi:hypothetical protein
VQAAKALIEDELQRDLRKRNDDAWTEAGWDR